MLVDKRHVQYAGQVANRVDRFDDTCRRRCLDDDACAYEDEDARCESGWVRSPHAAVDPGACVPPEDFDTSTTGSAVQCGHEIELVIDTAAVSPGTVLEGYPLLVSMTAPDLVAAIDSTEHEPFVVDAQGTTLAHEWEATHRRLVHGRQHICRVVSRVLRSARLTSLAVGALSLWPSLSRPVVAALNRPAPHGLSA